MDSLELLTRYGNVDSAEEAVINATAMAVLAAPDQSGTPDAPDGPVRPGSGGRWHRRTLIGAVSVAAAAALVVAGVSLAGTPRTVKPAAGVRAPAAQHPKVTSGHTVLARLASTVLAAPAPPGDATLVIRSQVLTGSSPILGADLYTDSGQYFYSPTASGLPAQVTAGNDQGGGIFAREIAAAETAATGTLASAAQAMEGAPDPTAITSPSTPNDLSPSLLANWLWENSLTALIAGAGNPAVRAGVMRLIATLPEVTVTDTTVNGVAALQLTARFSTMGKCPTGKSTITPAQSAALGAKCAALSGGGFQEQLTIDASTGVPISFAGGALGQAPAAITNYQVSRVTLTQVADGNLGAEPTTTTTTTGTGA